MKTLKNHKNEEKRLPFISKIEGTIFYDFFHKSSKKSHLGHFKTPYFPK